MNNTLAVWWASARPKTLGAAAAPVLMGTAVAWHLGGAHAPAAVAAGRPSCSGVGISEGMRRSAIAARSSWKNAFARNRALVPHENAKSS